MFQLEHDPMMALAFREDANNRQLKKYCTHTPEQLTKEAKRIEARNFEYGDHQPDGTVFYGDGNWSDPYHTHERFIDQQRAIDRRATQYLLDNPPKASWTDEDTQRLKELEARHREEKRYAKYMIQTGAAQRLNDQRISLEMGFYREQQRSVADEERLKFAREYIIQDPRQIFRETLENDHLKKIESPRKAAIWADIYHFAKNPWPCDEAAKL